MFGQAHVACRRTWRHLDDTSGILVYGDGALVRHLADDFSVFEIAFFRRVIAVFMIAPLVPRSATASFRTNQLPMHIWRVALTYSGIMCWFYGVSVFPLSDYYALQFTLPLFTIAGAVLLLGERTAPGHGSPSALPDFLAGLRISGGLALIGAVVAEYVAGTGGGDVGLATRIMEAGRRLEIARVFAGLVLLSVTGIVIYLALDFLSRLLLRHWHESADAGPD